MGNSVAKPQIISPPSVMAYITSCHPQLRKEIKAKRELSSPNKQDNISKIAANFFIIYYLIDYKIIKKNDYT